MDKLGFPGGSEGKESACNARDLGSIPGLGRSPGEGYINPLQYSCLGNSMDRGTWQATVHGVTKSWTQRSNGHFHLSNNLHYPEGRPDASICQAHSSHRCQQFKHKTIDIRSVSCYTKSGS